MKCPYCKKEFEPDEDEEYTQVLVSEKKYDKLTRLACIGEMALAKK